MLSFSQLVIMHLRKRVSEPWFTLIGMGLKQVEGRLNKGDFARLETGDVIVWDNDELGFTRTCETCVNGMAHYRTFRTYLQGTFEPVPACGRRQDDRPGRPGLSQVLQ